MTEGLPRGHPALVLRGCQDRRREHAFACGRFQAGAREERLRGPLDRAPVWALVWALVRAAWQKSTDLETLGPALDSFGSLGRRRSWGTGREGSEEGRYATATAGAPGSGHISSACSASALLSCWLRSSLSPSPVPTALSLLR